MSLERWVGKLAVVTGASAGIGKAIAESLVKQGVNVAALARRLNRLDELAQSVKNEPGKLYPFQCDLSNDEEIVSTFKNITDTLGPISILVNNAGVAPFTDLIDGDISKWKQILDTNVLALSISTREAINSMKANDIKGHIININSVAGHTVDDFAGISLYPASKHAVTAYTESLRREINRKKLPIKVTSVSPGYVKTEFLTANFYPEITELISTPLVDGLESSDLADTVVYVLSTPEHVNIKELTLMRQGQTF